MLNAAGILQVPSRNIFTTETTIKKEQELVRELKMSVPGISDSAWCQFAYLNIQQENASL